MIEWGKKTYTENDLCTLVFRYGPQSVSYQMSYLCLVCLVTVCPLKLTYGDEAACIRVNVFGPFLQQITTCEICDESKSK